MNTVTVNFFDLSSNNNEPLHSETEFGLCDDDGENKELPAYSDSTQPETWIATVKNETGIAVQFYAIDKRIKILIDNNEVSLCDGMLICGEKLYLVELKVQRSEWIQGAIKQLRSTIEQLKLYHANELTQFKSKKAYACNRKHPNFAISHASTMRAFHQETGFRLDIQATINLK